MKVLILPNKIRHYRIEFYNAIHALEGVELTVGHTEVLENTSNHKFNTIHLPKSSFFNFQWELIKYYNQFDKIVSLFDFHYPLYFFISLFKKRNFIWWGIGKGNNRFLNWVRIQQIKYLPSPLIVYMDGTRDWYLKNKLPPSKIHVMGNTVHVNEPRIGESKEQKQNLLLIGTINERKKYEDFFIAYAESQAKFIRETKVVIIGDGPHKQNLVDLASKLGIQNSVEFLGKITDAHLLRGYFDMALATISPGQAGLTILHSFAHGTPVVAYEDAISGGELENITNGVTGYLCPRTTSDLAKTLLKTVNEPEKTYQMGKNALEFYLKERTIASTVERFIGFINNYGRFSN